MMYHIVWYRNTTKSCIYCAADAKAKANVVDGESNVEEDVMEAVNAS